MAPPPSLPHRGHLRTALRHARDRLTAAGAWMLAAVHTEPIRHHDPDDRGEVTEKAVLVAISLALALGLGAAIRTAVTHYQGLIH